VTALVLRRANVSRKSGTWQHNELHLHLVRRGIRIPTIVITSHPDPIVRERSVSAGATAFFAKPLQNVSLFAAIDAAISH
jgi:FixJ family two-component response regulator